MLFNTNALGTPDDNRKKKRTKKQKRGKEAQKQTPIQKIGLGIIIAACSLGIPVAIAFASYTAPIVLK
ncbi:MAG TPA: hypothetical protein P5056_03905 [Candidatus Paceibacterota bacterium]|nr:hypothetical protein [Candidatus Paceibacterota bacterium]